ncbi:unnamed protein product [Cunninghamella echinulata]
MASNNGHLSNNQSANLFRENNEYFQSNPQLLSGSSTSLNSLCLPNPVGTGVYINGQTSQIPSSYTMSTAVSNCNANMSSAQALVTYQTASTIYSNRQFQHFQLQIL